MKISEKDEMHLRQLLSASSQLWRLCKLKYGEQFYTIGQSREEAEREALDDVEKSLEQCGRILLVPDEVERMNRHA